VKKNEKPWFWNSPRYYQIENAAGKNGGAAGEKGYDAGKIPGIKVHPGVDTNGLLSRGTVGRPVKTPDTVLAAY
jgi:hypothetical protein